ERGAMGAGRTRSADAAEIAPSVSRQRPGATAHCIGVSLTLAEGAGSGKRRSASIHLPGGNHAVRELRPGKTGVFSRRQTCQGKSQEPCSSDGRIAGWRETQNLEVLEPIDKVSLGGITSHRAVTTVNVNVASKSVDPRAEPASEGRRQHGVPKSDRCGNPTSAG